MYSMTRVQHLGQLSHDLQENPAARLTRAPEHNGLFMLGVSDPDVWCSTPWFTWHPTPLLSTQQTWPLPCWGSMGAPDFSF